MHPDLHKYLKTGAEVIVRNLPSYFTTSGDVAGARNAVFLNNRQINWDAIYYGNTDPITDSNNNEIGRIGKVKAEKCIV